MLNRTAETLVRETGVYTPASYDWSNEYGGDYQPESYEEYTQTLKSQSAGYDALGRLTSWAEAGTYTSPAASIANSYDAAGNVRRTQANWRTLQADGTASSAAARDYWFRYDAMNRVVLDQGILQNGAIVHGGGMPGDGAGGRAIAYDVGGRRVSVTTTTGGWDGYGWSSYDTQELYGYDAADRLVETRERGASEGGAGRLRSTYGYDRAGRQVAQSDYDYYGQTVVYSRGAGYNAKGQLASESGYTLRNDGTGASSNSYYGYGEGAAYALGAVTSRTTSSYANYQSSSTSTTTSYLWYDGALQAGIAQASWGAGGSTNWSTAFGYDALGRLASASVYDGKSRKVSFLNDEQGQVIRRDESLVAGQAGAPHEVWYRFGGRQLGYTGNNGTSEMAMAASIEDRRVVPSSNQGTFRNKQLYGSAYADFAQSYDPLNSYGQGSAGGSYTVQRGDTLASIARAVWGDANLWYQIADANGLGASPALIEGQRLTLPTGVVRNTHNAGTLKPYDPASALGDVTPGTSPQAATGGRRGGRCGTFGAILIAVVAVAVAVATAGVAVAALGPAGTSFASGLSTVLGTGVFGGTAIAGGVAGAVGAGGAIALGAASTAFGSIVSQGLGVATGIQDKFSWTGVALAGLSGGIGGALGSSSGIVQSGLKAAAGSAIAQGVAVATGLQDRFDWAGVAAAGIGGAAGRLVGGTSGKFGTFAGASAATLVANTATRSALTGSSFGDNVLAALPDTIATILFRAVGEASNHKGQQPSEAATRRPTDQTAPAAQVVQAGSTDSFGRITIDLSDPRFSIGIPGELLPPETRIMLAEFGGSISPENATRLRERLVDIKSQLRADYVASSPSGAGFATGLGSDGRPILEVSDAGYALDMGTLNSWQAQQEAALKFGNYSTDGIDQFRASIEHNRDLVRQWDRQADAQLMRDAAFIGSTAYDMATFTPVGGVIDLGIRAATGDLHWADAAMLIPVLGKGVNSLGKLGSSAVEATGARFSGAYAKNGDLVQSVATRAEAWGTRQGLGGGPVAGTLKHGYAENVLKRYQRMFGDRGLTAEARYVGGTPWRQGRPLAGSIRLDVVEGPLARPTGVWDYKFGNASLSQGRITQIQNGIPNGANVPILMVKP